MKQKAIDDPAFAVYGRVISGYDCEELLKKMNETPLPEDVIYVPSVAELEMLPIAK
ncbi:MAG: DUF4867 family protein, partial [Hungatella sp.]